MSHFKGEWKSELTENGSFITCKGTTICEVLFNEPINFDEFMRNAKLLSAAPDLLDALIAIMDAEGGEPNDDEASVNAWELARKAIEKATTK